MPQPATAPGLEPLTAALPLQVESGKPGFLEHDLAQEAREEVASAARMLSGQEAALESESASERAHHAIDRASFLRAAREVDAADDELGLELRRGERGVDELHEAVAQQRELLREAIEQRASRGVALLLELLGQPIVQASLQPLQLGRHGRGVEPFLAVRERESPRLRSLLLAERREELG